MSALATFAPAGLDEYMDLLEERLEEAVASQAGLVREIGTETLAAGASVFARCSSSSRRQSMSERANGPSRVAPPSSSFTWQPSCTTTCSTGPRSGAGGRRRGPRTGPTPPSRRAIPFACAFVQLARTGDTQAVGLLAEAALALARGEALQRRQAFRPDTSVDDYLARCSLKTGKLFEAACLLGGSNLGSFGLALGIAFQIADDILDCAGDHVATGKAGGVDLKDGTPTLPLILAARRDPVVWRRWPARTVPTRSSGCRPPERSTTRASSRAISLLRHEPRSTASRTATRSKR